MLISYRDSKRYPSDPLALKTWVRVAAALACQVVCRTEGFDALQFARALELCRGLTRRPGSEAIGRMVKVCAAAGVAVVMVPGFDGCHASSASRWLGLGKRRRAMIALSLRYRRDDQLYFSLFREAGAILAAHKHEIRSTKLETKEDGSVAEGVSDFGFRVSDLAQFPNAFARQFLVPPQYDQRLLAIGAMAEEAPQAEAIRAFAKALGIAPGLVVGRLQHDELILWKQQNRLKREVDLTYVLKASEAAEETWPDQSTAAALLMKDLNLDAEAARHRLERAVRGGAILTNGQKRRKLRLEPGQLSAWRLFMRDRDLDREEAAA